MSEYHLLMKLHALGLQVHEKRNSGTGNSGTSCNFGDNFFKNICFYRTAQVAASEL